MDDVIGFLQWPAMVATLTAAWLVGSQSTFEVPAALR